MITNYFKRQRLCDEQPLQIEAQENPAGHDAAASATTTEEPSSLPKENVSPSDVDELYLQPKQLPEKSKSRPLSKYDIALAIKSPMSDSDRFEFLINVYKPAKNYIFQPVLQANRKRYIQQSWFDKNEQLAFSHIEHGLYCKAYVLFGSRDVGKGRNNSIGKFVTDPYRRFKDFTEDWKNHTETNYHQLSCEVAANFVVTHNNSNTVVQQIDIAYKENVKKNREMLNVLLEALFFIARYELPLRGDKDHGRLTSEEPEENDGVFRGILRLMLKSGDERMEKLLDAPANATYMGPSIQNEMLDCFARAVIHEIAKEVNDAQVFSILADETSTASRELLTIALRYVDKDGCIQEAFIGFESVCDQTGETLCNSIVQKIQELRVQLSGLVGQGYDGAANMSGVRKGVQARMKEICPLADYYHCASHRLNLAAMDASTCVPIRHFLSRVQDILVFFDGSPNRLDVLRRTVHELLPNCRKERVQQLCPTRWVERHTTLESFAELFLPLTTTLQYFADQENDRNAEDLLKGVTTFESIVAMNIVTKAAGILKHLSVILQSATADLISSHQEICNTIGIVKESIVDESQFEELYQSSISTATDMGVNEALPSRQKRLRAQMTSNDDIKSYYREKVYMEYLTAIVSELQLRFSDSHLPAFKLQYFLPQYIDDLTYETIADTLSRYAAFFVDTTKTVVEPELKRWKNRVKAEFNINDSVAVLTSKFGGDNLLQSFYPTVSIALKLLATLPVTTATAERSFSTMKRINTDLRSLMLTKRLSSLAILSVHKKRVQSIDLDTVIDLFADNCGRRIALR